MKLSRRDFFKGVGASTALAGLTIARRRGASSARQAGRTRDSPDT